MTPRQNQTLECIRSYWAGKGHGPSYAEIAAGLGVVKSGAFRLVGELEGQGLVERQPLAVRSVRPKDIACPHCGRAL